MKRIVCFIVAMMMSASLTACSGTTVQNEKDAKESTSMFVVVEQMNDWDIVYHKETLVMYAVSDGLYNRGSFTVLVNADGTPMLWPE